MRSCEISDFLAVVSNDGLAVAMSVDIGGRVIFSDAPVANGKIWEPTRTPNDAPRGTLHHDSLHRMHPKYTKYTNIFIGCDILCIDIGNLLFC